MKRVLILALLLPLLISVVSAAVIKVDAPDETVVGRTFNVSIKADIGTATSDNDKLAGFEMYIQYDKLNISVKDVHVGNDTKNWQVYYRELEDWELYEYEGLTGVGFVKVIGVYNGNETLIDGDNVELFKIEFNALSSGDTEIKVNETLSKLVEKDEDTKDFTTTSDNVKIWKYGDVNKDDTVDVRDLVRLEKIILGEETKTITADVDNDGEIDVADLITLINYLVGT